LVAWQSEPRKTGALRAWLAGVVRRLALSRRRSIGRREAREAHAAVAERLPSVEEVALREEARQALVAALLALEEPYRTTLMWRYYSGRSVADIAALQDVPVNTVRTRIQRGLARLRVGLSAAHAGDDRRWRSALLPLAGSGTALVPTAGTVVGGLLVKKALAGGLAALLLVAAGVAWWAGDSDRPALDGPQREPLAASELAPTMTGSSGPHLEGRATDAVERSPANGPSRYAGQVVDQVGRMVAGARVEVRGICNDEACASRSTGVVEGEPLAEARTMAEGLFRLPAEFERAPWDPRPHAVWVHVLADGFALAEAAVVRDQPARIVLAPGGMLVLTLLNAEGRAARGAKVALYRGEAEIPAPGWGGIPLVWTGAGVLLFLSCARLRARRPTESLRASA
jgi:RNA polymerase sigma factor (sigma-70 family)